MDNNNNIINEQKEEKIEPQNNQNTEEDAKVYIQMQNQLEFNNAQINTHSPKDSSNFAVQDLHEQEENMPENGNHIEANGNKSEEKENIESQQNNEINIIVSDRDNENDEEEGEQINQENVEEIGRKWRRR